MDDAHLIMPQGKSIRIHMDMLVNRALYGGIDPGTRKAVKGVASIADQIQQLATMDITRN